MDHASQQFEMNIPEIRGKSAKRQRCVSVEPIVPGELWPMRLLHRRLGWGARAQATAIREGLKVHRWGKYGFVATDDLIEFLTRHDAD
jgi:hypothetical protein